ncbi:MAG: glycosyltransferase family 8 protein [Clostridiales bacterium]|nr:glycosyltransferase family 8 protein [Clostridiales bacterium]
MNILVTLDSNYIKPLKIMLWSLFFNNKGEKFDIYLMHSSITKKEIDDLHNFVSAHNNRLFEIRIPANTFKSAPVVKHYSVEMYYRLLAYKFLPTELDRVLYLDPDILVINPIRELYDMDIEGYLYAASYHNRIPLKVINALRLKAYEMEEYFNSGVLLMNLPLHRNYIKEQDIFDYISKNKNRLLLPDQDVLNALYSKKIKKLDEIEYNYDARFYLYYKLQTNGKVNMDYIMRNTVILHFCGKNKPWNPDYNGNFKSLYKHYEILALYR